MSHCSTEGHLNVSRHNMLWVPVLGPVFPLMWLKHGCCYGWLLRKRVPRGCIIQQLESPCLSDKLSCMYPNTDDLQEPGCLHLSTEAILSPQKQPWGKPLQGTEYPGPNAAQREPQALSSRLPMSLPVGSAAALRNLWKVVSFYVCLGC